MVERYVRPFRSIGLRGGYLGNLRQARPDLRGGAAEQQPWAPVGSIDQPRNARRDPWLLMQEPRHPHNSRFVMNIWIRAVVRDQSLLHTAEILDRQIVRKPVGVPMRPVALDDEVRLDVPR